MKYTALISLMVIVTVSSAPVYVDELEDFVTSKEDKNALNRLDDDDYMIRYEKQRQLDAILQRQSPYVQVSLFLSVPPPVQQ
ncbi:hypothetical protein GCK32_004730 [Trichostrongylus colubriformis]|uniref:Uncharacterized protein n=1 Tax=Trichostrongylus colubriformis TaxID=6319 RepID=A0AAN8IX61_TRICO